MKLFLLGVVLGFMIGVAVTVLYFAFKTFLAANAKPSFTEIHSPRTTEQPAENAEIGRPREKARATGA